MSEKCFYITSLAYSLNVVISPVKESQKNIINNTQSIQNLSKMQQLTKSAKNILRITWKTQKKDELWELKVLKLKK